ncbi:MAG: pentapeptide repeat-containing protein [Cyanobacteria bacterium P01_A01_bin.17]
MLAVVTFLLVVGLSDWTGFKRCLTPPDLDQCTFIGKSTWEWLKLLIAPAILTAGGILANQYLKNRDEAQRQQDKELAKDAERYNLLKDYLDQMTQLLLKAEWPENRNQETGECEENATIVAIARARTLAVLSELDGRRKGSLIEFLVESQALQFVSLEGANLSSANLSGANLSSANLSSANLSSANLSGANLSRANLSSANLIEASLFSANLSRADLSGAYLINALLPKANLNKTNLSNAYLEKADLNGAQLVGADLNHAHAPETNFIGAQLMAANLGGIHLSRSKLWGADLRGTNLIGASFNNADLSSANLSGANLGAGYHHRASYFSPQVETILDLGADVSGANLSRVNFDMANIKDIIFNEDTKWEGVLGLDTAQHVPEKLKQKLDSTPAITLSDASSTTGS